MVGEAHEGRGGVEVKTDPTCMLETVSGSLPSLLPPRIAPVWILPGGWGVTDRRPASHPPPDPRSQALWAVDCHAFSCCAEEHPPRLCPSPAGTGPADPGSIGTSNSGFASPTTTRSWCTGASLPLCSAATAAMGRPLSGGIQLAGWEGQVVGLESAHRAQEGVSCSFQQDF